MPCLTRFQNFPLLVFNEMLSNSLGFAVNNIPFFLFLCLVYHKHSMPSYSSELLTLPTSKAIKRLLSLHFINIAEKIVFETSL